MKSIIILFFLLFLSDYVLGAEQLSRKRIFTTSELHAAVGMSTISESGGVAGVAEYLNSFKNDNYLLFYGGGFSAGGLYDFGTVGHKGDSIRTGVIRSHMMQMNYSAVTLGDDDLAWGADRLKKWQHEAPLPLVSANVTFDNDNRVQKFIMIPGEQKFFITGLTTLKPLLPSGAGINLNSLSESLEDVLVHAPEDALVVLLAHLTPEELNTVLSEFPQIDLVVRGHRQGNGDSLERIHRRPVIPFGFEGSRLVSAQLSGKLITSSEWIEINSEESSVSDYPSRELFDLYMMSGCPYGTAALKDILMLYEKSSSVEFNLWFSGYIEDGELRPGLPNGNVEWEKQILAVQSVYPERFTDFLWLLVQDGYTVEKVVDEMKLSEKKLRNWIRDYGEGLLSLHYRRAARLALTASPVLYINNRKYDGEISASRFLFELCRNDLESGSLCSGFGDCLKSSDCRSPGKVGKCEGVTEKSMKCHYYEDLSFQVIQILPDDTAYIEQNSFVATTKELFQNASIRTVRHGEHYADSLLKSFDAQILPFYLIDTVIADAVNYSKVSEGLEIKNDKFVFRKGYMSGNIYINRPVDTDMKVFADIESLLFENLKSTYPEIKLYPYFMKNFIEENESKIQDALKKAELSVTSVEYYSQWLEGIIVGAPVYALFDNYRVREFHSKEEFDQWAERQLNGSVKSGE